MNSSVTGTLRPTKEIKRGAAHRFSGEKLNGGGFKTTIHHLPAKSTGTEYEPQPKPIEAAHKNFKAAMKHISSHFGEQGVQGADAPSAGPGGMEPIES